MGLFSKLSQKAVRSSEVSNDLPPPIIPVDPKPMPMPAVGTDTAGPRPMWLRTTGRFDLEVVGESHYFDALRKLTNRSAGEITLRATLVREPTNTFDSGAVRVDVEGHKVGYIARDIAPDFHSLLDEVASRGGYAIVPALVWSSGDPRNFIASVRLDIADPAIALPINEPVGGGHHRCWPEGKRVQLTDEADFMASISAALKRGYAKGHLAAWFELVAPESGSRVEVTLDGAQVGRLSGPASKKFGPHVERVRQMGHSVSALGEIKGNSMTAEISLSLANPEDLSEEQIAELLA